MVCIYWRRPLKSWWVSDSSIVIWRCRRGSQKHSDRNQMLTEERREALISQLVVLLYFRFASYCHNTALSHRPGDEWWNCLSTCLERSCLRLSLITASTLVICWCQKPGDVVVCRRCSSWWITGTHHNLSKRLTVEHFHLFCPEPFISPPFSPSRTHPPHLPAQTHAHIHPPPSVIHPPPSTSVADGGGGREAYKRVRDFGGRAEETSLVSKSCDQLPPTATCTFSSALLSGSLASVSCSDSRSLSQTHTHTHIFFFFFSNLCEPPAPVTVAVVRHLYSCHSMQLLMVIAALMGVLFSVRAAAVLPVEDRSPIHLNRVRRLILIFHLYFTALNLTVCIHFSCWNHCSNLNLKRDVSFTVLLVKYKVWFLICIEEFSRENLLSFKCMLLIHVFWIEKEKNNSFFFTFSMIQSL